MQQTSELGEQLQQCEGAALAVVPAHAVRPDTLLQRVWSAPQLECRHRCTVLLLRRGEGILQSGDGAHACLKSYLRVL